MSSTLAVVVHPTHPDRLILDDAEAPTPDRNELIVPVKAFSLNRGEVRRSESTPAGWRPGWDFAGVVERAAANGSGPKPGSSRCWHAQRRPAWAETIAAPSNAVAELPDDVSFEIASTLPVAGLTSLHSLYKGGFLAGKSVLVTGATGGTGDFTIQLAKLGGVTVVALVRSQNRVETVKQFGADHIIVGDDLAEAKRLGPYPLIVDSVGGALFGQVNNMLAPRGVHVIFGTTAGNDLTFAGNQFYPVGMASIYGFILFQELNLEPASVGLKVLAKLVAEKKLKPRIDVVESWTKVAAITRKLTNREFVGKAVLTIE